MKTILLSWLIILTVVSNVNAQKTGTQYLDVLRNRCRHEIALPDIPGYKTLKCDFHIHTVFSDGIVWPTVRVNEAWEDGLDAIAITDHIEGHPKKLPGQNHQSYEIALTVAKMKNIILVKGGEISRGMPPGHFNALFVKDVNALNKPDYMDALEEAVLQGGFIQWNHPGWRKQQRDTTRWMAIHEELYQRGWMHGIEIFNNIEWYPEAIQWALDKHLSMTGNSDMHDVLNHNYNTDQFPIRPMTLVFATERTEEALREAMFAHRTVALFFNKLVGPKEWVEPIVLKSILVSEPFLYQDGYAFFEVKNVSDIEFTFIKKGIDDSGLPDKLVLPRRSMAVIKVKKTSGILNTYTFRLENVMTGVEQFMEFNLNIK